MLTEIEIMRLQLLQAEAKASVGLLMPGVAHDINNSVAAISSNLDSLAAYTLDLCRVMERQNACIDLLRSQGVLPEDSNQELLQLQSSIKLGYIRSDITPLLSDSVEATQRISDTVSRLSEFSVINDLERDLENDTNRDIDTVAVNLNTLVESAISLLSNELKYTTKITRELADLPDVLCHFGAMLQVFFSLLMNAVQAIESKGIIHLRSGVEKSRVWLEIADTGIGIAEKNMVQIFEPFFTTKQNTQNSGMGLYRVKSILEGYGGCVEVTSKKGEGAVFRVMMPRHKQPLPPSAGSRAS